MNGSTSVATGKSPRGLGARGGRAEATTGPVSGSAVGVSELASGRPRRPRPGTLTRSGSSLGSVVAAVPIGNSSKVPATATDSSGKRNVEG